MYTGIEIDIVNFDWLFTEIETVVEVSILVTLKMKQNDVVCKSRPTTSTLSSAFLCFLFSGSKF